VKQNTTQKIDLKKWNIDFVQRYRIAEPDTLCS